MNIMHRKILSGTLLTIILCISLMSSSPLFAQEQAEKIKPVVRPNVQTINPSIRKELIKPQIIKSNTDQLSTSKYQAIIRAHNARVQAVATKQTAQAITTLDISSQNHAFRGEYDCDDRNRQAYPGGSEICDGFDNNCDGDIDENVTNTFYLDADGDSWGDSTRTYLACDTPSGYAVRPNDCDDTNLVIYPGASDENGNDIDENCNSRDG